MTTVLLALGFALAWGGVAAGAPDRNNASAAPPQTRPAPDFLFGEPRGSIGVRGSWVFARAGGDLFEFLQKQLTIAEGDFDAPAVAVDVGLAVAPRADVLFGFEFIDAGTRSEYRAYVDSNRRPITQETALREANLSGSVRIALMSRGRRVSRLAWIPRRATPYAGAGGGLLWYRFQQQGDFIDVFNPRLTVFTDRLTSQGWTPSAHAFGGVDVRLSRRLFLAIEGRYLWASASLERSFEGFDPIDLAGLRMTAGVNVLF